MWHQMLIMSHNVFEQIGQKYLTTSKGMTKLQYINLAIAIMDVLNHYSYVIDPPPFSSQTKNQIKAQTIPTPKAHKLRYLETKHHTLAKCFNVYLKKNYLHNSRSNK